MSGLERPAPRALDTIASEIRQDIEAADKHWQSAVHHAIRAGEGLIEAKATLRHGQWLPWLEENFPGFSARSAQNYMRLARNRNAVADLPTIREAVATLAAPRENVDHLERARDYIAKGDEEFRKAGIEFRATGLKLPDDLSFEDWQRIGRFLGKIVPEAAG
jgi:Protein of unknown function (DUF3102)